MKANPPAGKKKKTADKPKVAASPALISRLRPLIPWTLAMIAVVSLGWFLGSSLHARLYESPSLKVAVADIVVSPARPEYIQKDIRAAVFDDLKLSKGDVRLWDDSLLPKLGEAFRKQPWVADVSVVRGWQNLTVNLTYRRPVLFVLRNEKEGQYLDEAGIVLPWAECSREVLKTCLSFDGKVPAELPEIGFPYRDQQVLLAAKLAGMLAEISTSMKLVRVGQKPGTDGLFLWTSEGTSIRWGKVDGDFSKRLGRLADLQKRINAAEQLGKPGSFDLERDLGVSPSP